MLRQARVLAEESIALRERHGEAVNDRTPPVVARRVLDERIAQIESGDVGPGSRTLGLARGADDFVWLPEEGALRQLLSEIDAYWEKHIWDGSGPEGWQSLKVRHVHRSPRP
jgi:hypothetical protein